MNETELIQRLTRDLPTSPEVVVGPGDDCAVLEVGLADRWLLFKTDAVVEGVHFTGPTPGDLVGHKALARCLSDVAAMGGQASSALVTLALPPQFEVARVDAIYAGLSRLARRFGVAIVGGETTTHPERLLLSVALLGWVEKTRCVRRSGARPGAALFVSGELGGSIVKKHLEFEPRLVEARWLVAHFQVQAMIDLSDGLATDLRHLLDASQVGAELLADAIPISGAARERPAGAGPGSAGMAGDSPAPLRAKPPLLAALTDGEDFELLFAVASQDAVAVLDGWRAQFPQVRLSCIGRTTAGGGLQLRDRQGVRPLEVHGYTHFA
ncbi:MAG: thiamine-phosphate kinase [Verrucomicrobia bacterium]|nr:thiamine-phosphate kinase [Verrucomicrobiota bacterium]